MDKQLAVRFTDAEYERLRRYADDTERTLSQTIRYAVKQLIPPSSFHPIIEDDIAVMPMPEIKIEIPKRTGQGSIQAILAQYRDEAS